LGRSLASGGLINTRTVESKRTAKQLDAEEIVFVFGDDDSPAMLRETELVYQSLGAAMQPSRAANFAYLATTLRERCAAATWDERLRRRAAQAQILGHALSPDDDFDLAVALVAHHRRR
jgi:hypothetical protein